MPSIASLTISVYRMLILYMCLMSSVPVKFSAATYYVTEGQSTVDITLEARVISAYSFYLFTVFVVTRDGTALGECQ